MKKTLFLSGAAILAFSALSNTASAHLYWVEPNEFFFYDATKKEDKKVSEQLTWEFTGGDTYFNADVNRAFNNVKNYDFTYILPSGKKGVAARSFQGKNRAVFEADVTEEGTYTLQTSRVGKPMYYTKLENGEWIHKGKTELSSDERKNAVLTNAYFQHVKGYSSFHKTTDAWKKVLGHTLEVVPFSHPNKLYVGDELTIQVLYQGKPLADSEFKVIDQNYRFEKHGQAPQLITTDKNGMAKITFPHADRYLIHAEHTSALQGDEEAEAQNHRASLMLEVNKKWVKSIAK